MLWPRGILCFTPSIYIFDLDSSTLQSGPISIKSSSLTMLCVPCQTILTSEKIVTASIQNEEPRIHHPSCRSLRASVELGCYVCNRFWASLFLSDRRVISIMAESEPGFDNKINNVSSVGVVAEPTQPFITAFCLDNGPPYGHLGWYQMNLALNPTAINTLDMLPSRVAWTQSSFLLQPQKGAAIIAGLIKGRGITNRKTDAIKVKIGKELSENTHSIKTFSLAKKWIAECVANHEQCSKSATKKGWYPTRLLQVESSSDSDLQWRLLETKSARVEGPYTTLSHCWGSAHSINLTTENYAGMLLWKSAAVLPQLYKDALHVAHNLGISYLWIDALCIVQTGDNFTDWQHEVESMSDIYSNSFCNISAADAPDAHHSMFTSRGLHSICPETVLLNLNKQPSPYLLSDTRLWDSEISQALVNSRAWVLQERLLSPRVLYFGERQML